MLIEYYLKSHYELPDVENYVNVDIKPETCIIKLASDIDDTYGYTCNGKIIWGNNYGECQDCGCQYYIN